MSSDGHILQQPFHNMRAWTPEFANGGHEQRVRLRIEAVAEIRRTVDQIRYEKIWLAETLASSAPHPSPTGTQHGLSTVYYDQHKEIVTRLREHISEVSRALAHDGEGFPVRHKVEHEGVEEVVEQVVNSCEYDVQSKKLVGHTLMRANIQADDTPEDLGTTAVDGILDVGAAQGQLVRGPLIYFDPDDIVVL